ncbi:hypothetical protein ABZ215_13800 [Amycolatopsis sp. NPDC006131]|uniref:hypothetical protein n=1 Tax=Amycolatopsis sp. NPDC006131 TaxID=3156731 RepID=UPI0033BEE069
MSGELVGPVPTIYFHGGPGGARTVHRQAYEVPRNTLDPRFAACTEHHPACDCREAVLAEEQGELRAELTMLYRAVRTVLAGHRTWDWDDDRANRPGLWLGDGPNACQCSGCKLVRTARVPVSSVDGDYHTGRIPGGAR